MLLQTKASGGLRFSTKIFMDGIYVLLLLYRKRVKICSFFSGGIGGN
jgi:hypothetical protein